MIILLQVKLKTAVGLRLMMPKVLLPRFEAELIYAICASNMLYSQDLEFLIVLLPLKC